MSTQFASNRLKDAILSEVSASVSSVSVYSPPCDSVNELIPLITDLKGGGLNDERVISAFTKAIDSLCKTSDNTALTKKRCKHIASMLVVYLGTIWE